MKKEVLDRAGTEVLANEINKKPEAIELTQAEYDALPDEDKQKNTIYYIKDGKAPAGKGGQSVYEYAVESGYEGTEEDFKSAVAQSAKILSIVDEYDKLKNLPTINGVEVKGDLTSEDLGIGNKINTRTIVLTSKGKLDDYYSASQLQAEWITDETEAKIILSDTINGSTPSKYIDGAELWLTRSGGYFTLGLIVNFKSSITIPKDQLKPFGYVLFGYNKEKLLGFDGDINSIFDSSRYFNENSRGRITYRNFPDNAKPACYTYGSVDYILNPSSYRMPNLDGMDSSYCFGFTAISEIVLPQATASSTIPKIEIFTEGAFRQKENNYG